MVLMDSKSKKAFGVRYFKHGEYHEVYARKEIVSSAGVLKTPQLLLLSGIGPKDDLKKLNIPVIEDLPVGLNLQDHSAFPLVFLTDQPITYIPSRFNNILTNMTYDLYKRGPLSSPTGFESTAFINTRFQDPKLDFPDVPLFILASSPATDGGIAATILNLSDELLETIYNPKKDRESFHIFVVLNHSKSRGKVSLKSRIPFEKPQVNMNYFDNSDDVKRLIDAGKFALKLVEESQAFKEINAKYHFVPIPTCPDAVPPSDEFFECYMRYFSVVLHHLSGTAKMAPNNDPTRVVDPELRVRGISGLRVADTSIMPIIITGTTNTPAIMIGEKASDLIKNSWKNYKLK
ncbi:UNVERIFIED_CONTAM: hypothetical protein RMT77_006591 [Armadillidium vulgare]